MSVRPFLLSRSLTTNSQTMSFGFSPGDVVVITQLAFNVVQNARKACGAHDGLTREVSCLHVALHRLQNEASKSQLLLNCIGDDWKDELATLIEDCGRILNVLSRILQKYNALSEEKRSVTKLWQRVKFGNGEMQDLSKIRLELMTYTSLITMFINTLSLGSQGKVEEYMTLQGGELQGMRRSLNWIVASLQASSGNTEGSILTSYTDDNKAIWKDFRRELIKEGYSSDFLKKHKEAIQNYVYELGQRGALDQLVENAQHQMDEAQIHKGSPKSSKDLEKTTEHPVLLSEVSICAAGEILAEDKVGRDEDDQSDGADSVKSHPTWGSLPVDKEFYNSLSQKKSPLRETERIAGYKDECGVESVNISASERAGFGGRNTGRFNGYRSPSMTSSEDIDELYFSGMYYEPCD